MSKRIKDTKEGRAINGYVVLRGEDHVATVLTRQTTNHLYVEVKTFACAKEGFKVQTGVSYRSLNTALHGLTINGEPLYDDCSESKYSRELLQCVREGTNGTRETILETYRRRLGVRFEKYEEGLPTVCWEVPGLERLTELGYQIIEV
jgi:hypothetical protein